MSHCHCHERYFFHSWARREARLKIRKIASLLGINAGMVDLCSASRETVIAMALRRSHENPLLWVHLMALYQSVDTSPAISKLIKSGNSGRLTELINKVNSSKSSNSATAFVDSLVKEQEKQQNRSKLASA